MGSAMHDPDLVKCRREKKVENEIKSPKNQQSSQYAKCKKEHWADWLNDKTKNHQKTHKKQ